MFWAQQLWVYNSVQNQWKQNESGVNTTCLNHIKSDGAKSNQPYWQHTSFFWWFCQRNEQSVPFWNARTFCRTLKWKKKKAFQLIWKLTHIQFRTCNEYCISKMMHLSILCFWYELSSNNFNLAGSLDQKVNYLKLFTHIYFFTKGFSSVWK